jgi:hypothetical protein
MFAEHAVRLAIAAIALNPSVALKSLRLPAAPSFMRQVYGCLHRKKSTNPKVGALSLTHGEVFLAAPIRGDAGEVFGQSQADEVCQPN